MKKVSSSVLWTVCGVIVLLVVGSLLFFDSNRNAPLTEVPVYYWLLYGLLILVLAQWQINSTLASKTSGLDVLFYIIFAAFNLMLVFFKVLEADLDAILPFWLIMGVSFAVSAWRSLCASRSTKKLQRL